MKSLALVVSIAFALPAFSQETQPQVPTPPAVDVPLSAATEPAPESEPAPTVEPAPEPVKNPDWPQEPDGFAGQLFGTQFEDMPANMKTDCEFRKTKTAEDPHKVCVNPSFPITANIHCIAKFEYMKGATGEIIFTGVELQISNKNIQKVKNVMLEKYGRPMDRDTDDKLTRGQVLAVALFGGPTTDPKKISEWYGLNVRIILTETKDPFGRSRVSIRHTIGAQNEAENSAF